MSGAEFFGLSRRLLRHLRRLPSVSDSGALSTFRSALADARALPDDAKTERMQALRTYVTLLEAVETQRDLVRLDSGDVHDEAEKLRLSAKRAGLELPDAEKLEEGADSAAKYEDRVSDFMDKSLFRPK